MYFHAVCSMTTKVQAGSYAAWKDFATMAEPESESHGPEP